MAKRKTGIALALLGCLALVGCSSVVARVNGVNITRKEFHEELERTQGLQMLQAMVMRRLLMEKAKAQGLVPTAEEVDQRFQEIKKERFENDQAFLNWMKSEALDDTIILDQIKFDMILFNLRTAHLKPTDEELKRFFDEHREQMFDKPERFTFRQIVLPNKEQAQQLLHRFNTEELIFSDVARKASIDTRTAETGGMVEEINKELLKQQARPIYDALVTLKENELYQKPIEVGGAFVILKLLKSLPAEPADWNKPETRKMVREAYLQVNAKSEEELLAEVTAGAEVVVLDDRYKAAIEPRFAAQAPGANLPPAVQEQLNKPPELTEPTEYDESGLTRPLPSDAAPSLPGAPGSAPTPAPAPAPAPGGGR